eukprot:35318_1
MSTWTPIIAICFIFPILFYASQASYNSIRGSTTIPGTVYSSAVGYDDENDIILILGGDPDRQQLIQFKNDEFISYDSAHFSSKHSIVGYGHNYFQLNHTLWAINQYGTKFVTISTHPPYAATTPGITIPSSVNSNGCLAMTKTHIFILGGSSRSDGCYPMVNAQIYDMVNKQWLSNVPSLPHPRMSIACYAVDDTLYSIGGGTDSCQARLDAILTLDISEAALADMSSQQWHVAPGTIHTPVSANCVAKHNNDLIVVGGYDINTDGVNDVNVINTLTGDCALAGTLSLGTYNPACLIHPNSNTLYIFGGGRDNTAVDDKWQYINLPTEDPTTADPTSNPSTVEPTTSNPTTSDPTTANPSTSEPTTATPTTTEPTADPSTSEPTTANPTTTEPTPADHQPTIAAHPTTSNPTMTTMGTTVFSSTIARDAHGEVKADDVLEDGANDAVLYSSMLLMMLFIVSIALACWIYHIKRGSSNDPPEAQLEKCHTTTAGKELILTPDTEHHDVVATVGKDEEDVVTEGEIDALAIASSLPQSLIDKDNGTDGTDSDSDDLYDDHRQKETAGGVQDGEDGSDENGNPTPGEGNGPAIAGICVDCGLVKMGAVFGDELFYCDDCTVRESQNRDCF